MDRSKIARVAARRALELRKEMNVSPVDPIDAISFAEGLGLHVRIKNIPSMEGFYTNCPPTILVTSERSSGRMAFNVGHELGHHVYGHETFTFDLTVDDNLSFNTNVIEEMEANYFSGFLLMPNRAVRSELAKRGWCAEDMKPEQAFRLSSIFGVSYAAIVQHMRFSLSMLPGSVADNLLKVPPSTIKESLLGEECPKDLIVVDDQWGCRPVDLRVGDLLLVNNCDGVEGDAIILDNEASGWRIGRPCRQGVGNLLLREKKLQVRVSGKIDGSSFDGLSKYRFLRDPDDK